MKWTFFIVTAIVFGGSFSAVFRQSETWPFSHYPMFSYPAQKNFSWFEIEVRKKSGETETLSSEKVHSLASMRLLYKMERSVKYQESLNIDKTLVALVNLLKIEDVFEVRFYQKIFEVSEGSCQSKNLWRTEMACLRIPEEKPCL